MQLLWTPILSSEKGCRDAAVCWLVTRGPSQRSSQMVTIKERKVWSTGQKATDLTQDPMDPWGQDFGKNQQKTWTAFLNALCCYDGLPQLWALVSEPPPQPPSPPQKNLTSLSGQHQVQCISEGQKVRRTLIYFLKNKFLKNKLESKCIILDKENIRKKLLCNSSCAEKTTLCSKRKGWRAQLLMLEVRLFGFE